MVVADQIRHKFPPQSETEGIADVGKATSPVSGGVGIRPYPPTPHYDAVILLLPGEICSDFAFLDVQRVGVRLEYPDRDPSAIAAGTRLAEEIQASLASVVTGSFDDEMKSLRGRSWSL